MKEFKRRFRFIGINLGTWCGAGRRVFVYRRVYYKHRWTPFVIGRFRYL